MKPFLGIATLFVCAPLSAQITLGSGDFADAGDTLRRSTGAVTAFDGADTGPAHVWDFGTLQLLTETADTLVTVGSTPLLYQFFFNNPFLYPEHNADYALKGTGFDFGALTVTDLYDYYKKDSDGLRNAGFGANINGLPASIQRDPVDWIHRFPMNYGDTNSSFTSYVIDVPGVIYFGQDQWRENEIDGWGTLYLPADTFEVLRVKSVLTRVDTIYVTNPFPFGFTLPEPETVEYKWLAVGKGGPVLQINTTGGFPVLTEIYYDPEDISTGIRPPTSVGAHTIFPNPAEDLVFIRLPERSAGELVLLDATGREVRGVHIVSSSSVAEINTTGLASGTYTLRLIGAASPWTGKLAIERR